MTEEKKPGKFASWIERTKTRAISIWEYCAEGVWEDQRDTAKVNIVKTLNLTVRSFMGQRPSVIGMRPHLSHNARRSPGAGIAFCNRTGFGIQNLLQTQLYQYFPSQHRRMEMAIPLS